MPPPDDILEQEPDDGPRDVVHRARRRNESDTSEHEAVVVQWVLQNDSVPQLTES